MINIEVTESPQFPGLAKQLVMTKGRCILSKQIDNKLFRELLQVSIKEGFEILGQCHDS